MSDLSRMSSREFRTSVPLKQRLAQREVLVGTWVKTPSYIVAEVLGQTTLDLVCLDAEHAPFDRAALDACTLACRASGMPVLVRPPAAAPEHLLNALDVGSDGVVVPHVRDGFTAASAVKHSHFAPGGRGFAGSTRAAGYTRRSMAEHLAAARSTVVIAQVEDKEGLENISQIVGTPGLDCVFIGRADLAVSLGKTSSRDDSVVAACELICEAAQQANCPVGMFVADLEEVSKWIARGVSLFLLESDHTFLISGARALASAVRQAASRVGP
jgi:2-keto-3-deoxy-L-rhamnonate aldolase RhmA